MAATVTGLLLAGGLARRFGANKICAALPDGTPVGLRAGSVLRDAGLEQVLAVVRAGDALTHRLFEQAGYSVVACAQADRGMAHTLAAGIAAAPSADAWLVALGDMPFVAPATVRAIVAAYGRTNAPVVPCHGGRDGHPVLFPARCGTELTALEGDVGARAVLDAHAGELVRLEVDDAGILHDVDVPADLSAGTDGGATARR